jgi:hypothetical protein
MTVEKDFLAIEKKFWTGGPEVYLENADKTCLVVFSEMARTMTREEIAPTAEAGRWRDVEITPKGFVELAPDAIVITYECNAKRKDGGKHHAFVSSAYVKRPEGWKLAFHQQTTIA